MVGVFCQEMWYDFNTSEIDILGFRMANTNPFLSFRKENFAALRRKICSLPRKKNFPRQEKNLYRSKNRGFRHEKHRF